MIREIKKQAWEIRSLNYKKFLPPLLLYIAANAAVYFLTKELSPFGILSDLHIDLQILALAVFLLLELAAIPIITTVLIKICLDCINCPVADTSVKKFLNKQNVKRIILINLIQNIFNIFYVTATLPQWAYLNIFGLKLGNIENLFLTLLNLYISYRFLICKYIFIQYGGSVRETLSASFKVMRWKFFKYLLLSLSFIPWIMLFVMPMFLVVLAGWLFESFINFGLAYSSTVSLSIPTKAVFAGIAIAMILFLTPYMYLAEVLFIRNSLSEEKMKSRDEYYGEDR
ncbi:MAG: hypothetical protein ACI4F7_07305 [Acutalibacteraceae bacterium]